MRATRPTSGGSKKGKGPLVDMASPFLTFPASASDKSIFSLPDELLIHCLANLEPHDLEKASLACKKWNQIIADESCWRCALETYFGSLPIRRVSQSSWKKEYLKRSRFLRCLSWDWRGRHVVQFEPRVGVIDAIHVDFEEGRMLAASLDKGMISSCNPSTGKVERSITCSGDPLTPVPVSCIKLDKFRIAVGYTTGHVGIVTNFRDRSEATIRIFRDNHNGPATELAWVPTLVTGIVSGGVDGNVRVWDVPTNKCIRLLNGNTSKITALACDARNYVIAGTESGSIIVWDLEISSFISKSLSSAGILNGLDSESAPVESLAPARIITMPQSDSTLPIPQAPIVSMVYDPPTSTAIIGCKLSQSEWAIRRIHVGTGAITGVFVQGHVVEPTCLVWDRPELGVGDRKTSIMVSGDIGGTICIWAVTDAIESKSSATPSSNPYSEMTRFKPTHVISNVHQLGVLSLHLDPFKIISGGADGGAKVWDVLTGRCIRTCTGREGGRGAVVVAAGPANAGKGVRAVYGGPFQIITAFGPHIRTWDFAPVDQAMHAMKSKPKQKSRRYAPARSNNNSNSNTTPSKRVMSPRALQLDWEDIKDIEREREYARSVSERRERNLHRVNGGGTDMTEDELVSYAMLLSVEEAERDALRRSAQQTPLIGPEILGPERTRTPASPPMPFIMSPDLTPSQELGGTPTPSGGGGVSIPDLGLPPPFPPRDNTSMSRSVSSRGSSFNHLSSSYGGRHNNNNNEWDEDDEAVEEDEEDDDYPTSQHGSYGSLTNRQHMIPSSVRSNERTFDDWPELEASPGKKIVFGSGGGGIGTAGSNSRMSFTPASPANMSRSTSYGNERETAWLQRSPHLTPSGGSRQQHSSVNVKKRSEEEELQHALELSLLDS
ncbi:hypothetical protein SmJEL517_g00754 [Synchytrium microbalum]|uniref:F-box domain-containing protein n=1 Tax=Synchytrium microbalum TaxID=1806994 RepID=A0A507CE42_9FUNG|nr:uncharacterized protein SmJEL517_g00754 [Synchytrium microbalum]TPX37618.1 hypothetical protein SmJEL517_g00754 [Synchytrium microbalum]